MDTVHAIVEAVNPVMTFIGWSSALLTSLVLISLFIREVIWKESKRH